MDGASDQLFVGAHLKHFTSRQHLTTRFNWSCQQPHLNGCTNRIALGTDRFPSYIIVSNSRIGLLLLFPVPGRQKFETFEP
jgi:hypothetical protein